MKHGKKFNESAKLIEKTKLYDTSEAFELACKSATAKFDETVEAHIRLGVDSRHADQQVRGAVVLPNGTGKDVRVAVFAKGDAADAAKAAGANIVGAEDLLADIQGGMLDFDVCIASPDMMGLVGRLGKVLGPRGLMPSPKAGTVTPDVAKAVPKQRLVRSSTVLIRQTSFTARSVRLLSVLKSSSRTSILLWKLSLRLSPLHSRVSTLSPALLLQQWAPALKSTQTSTLLNLSA